MREPDANRLRLASIPAAAYCVHASISTMRE